MPREGAGGTATRRPTTSRATSPRCATTSPRDSPSRAPSPRAADGAVRGGAPPVAAARRGGSGDGPRLRPGGLGRPAPRGGPPAAVVSSADVPPRPDPLGAVRAGRADHSCTRRRGTGSRWRSSSAGPRAPSRARSVSRARRSSRSRAPGELAVSLESRRTADLYRRTGTLAQRLGGRRRRAARHPEGDRVGGLVAGRQEPGDRAVGPRTDAARVPGRQGPVRDQRLDQPSAGIAGRKSRRLRRSSDSERRRRIDRQRWTARAA